MFRKKYAENAKKHNFHGIVTENENDNNIAGEVRITVLKHDDTAFTMSQGVDVLIYTGTAEDLDSNGTLKVGFPKLGKAYGRVLYVKNNPNKHGPLCHYTIEIIELLGDFSIGDIMAGDFVNPTIRWYL